MHRYKVLTGSDSVKEKTDRMKSENLKKRDGGGQNRATHTKQEERQRRTYKAKRKDGRGLVGGTEREEVPVCR